MHILKKIELDPTQQVAHVYVSSGDPSVVGLAAGINSIATVIGGTLAGNHYLKIGAGDTDWSPLVQANAILSKSVTLTNAQIKASPTAATYVEVVPAPGAGKVALATGGFLSLDCTAGVYTNVDTAAASGPTLNYKAQSGNTLGFGFSGASWQFEDGSEPQGSTFGFGLPNDVDPTRILGVNDTLARIENASIVVGFQNGSLGNLTGGHALNTMKVTVLYSLADV